MHEPRLYKVLTVTDIVTVPRSHFRSPAVRSHFEQASYNGAGASSACRRATYIPARPTAARRCLLDCYARIGYLRIDSRPHHVRYTDAHTSLHPCDA